MGMVSTNVRAYGNHVHRQITVENTKRFTCLLSLKLFKWTFLVRTARNATATIVTPFTPNIMAAAQIPKFSPQFTVTYGNSFVCPLKGTAYPEEAGSSMDHSISRRMVMDTGIKLVTIIT